MKNLDCCNLPSFPRLISGRNERVTSIIPKMLTLKTSRKSCRLSHSNGDAGKAIPALLTIAHKTAKISLKFTSELQNLQKLLSDHERIYIWIIVLIAFVND